MLAAVRERQGDAEILIANSGPPKAGAAANLTLADWDAAYGPTMRSMLQIVYAVLPAMRERGWGRIVNLSSSARQDADSEPRALERLSRRRCSVR